MSYYSRNIFLTIVREILSQRNMEAPMGFEPMNQSFAGSCDRPLRHSAMNTIYSVLFFFYNEKLEL